MEPAFSLLAVTFDLSFCDVIDDVINLRICLFNRLINYNND